MRTFLSRILLVATLFATTTAPVFAHMVYIVPAADRQSVTIVFGETLEPDPRVEMTEFSGSKFSAKTTNSTVAVALAEDKHSFTGKIPADASAVFGQAVYGISPKSDKPTLLVYHPKAIVGKVNSLAKPEENCVFEITAEKMEHDTRFRLWFKGKPVANAAGTLKTPRKDKLEFVTDEDGYTGYFHIHGRSTLYMKHIEPTSGEHQGAEYKEITHYATLVVDL